MTKNYGFVVLTLFISGVQRGLAQGVLTDPLAIDRYAGPMGRAVQSPETARQHLVSDREREKVYLVIRQLLKDARRLVEAGDIVSSTPIFERVTILYQTVGLETQGKLIAAESLIARSRPADALRVYREIYRSVPKTLGPYVLWIAYDDAGSDLLENALNLIKIRIGTPSRPSGYPIDAKLTSESIQATAMLLLGEDAIYNGMPKLSISRLTAAHKLAPKNWKICSMIGTGYFEIGNFAESAKWHELAAKNSKTDAEKRVSDEALWMSMNRMKFASVKKL